MRADEWTFELFVIHADADAPFVYGHLLPALGLDPERVLLSSGLALGALKVAELERGVQTSRLSVVVLSPAYEADEWAVFGEQLAGHLSRSEGRLIPLLRADCAVPLRLDCLVALDFRDPAAWEGEARRLRAMLAQPAEAVEPPCPYPGMRAYSIETARYFHGREAEVDELVGRLRAGEREIYVIGPSGSGKSSLVAAGVAPRLSRGVSGLGPFVVRSLRPGEHPAARLEEALEGEPAAAMDALRAAPGTSVLLVVDQLEELFVLSSADERARFLAGLRALRAEPRCALLFMLRADFYGAFMESALWDGRISRVDVAPLRRAALRAAIELPARDVGVYLEPELVERLLGDAATEPGVLPLLQETLIQLWERRRRRLLTLDDYQAMGEGGRSGLAVAIARRADATLRAMTPAQEAIARRIFLRLVSFGEGRADTRRQQPRAALRAAGDRRDQLDAVLRRLVADRLLTICDGERVDLAHEVLISAWPTLGGWIEARRADERRRRELEAAAALWSERGRGPGGLLDPIELAEAEAWLQTEGARELGASAELAALVAASKAAHARAQQQRRHALRRALGALVAAGAIVSALAIMNRRHANEAEARLRQQLSLIAAVHQEKARQRVLAGRPHEAVPYLVAARREGQRGEPLQMLFAATARYLPLTPPLEHGARVTGAAFSPDGARVVTVSWDHTARVWDAATGAPLTPPLQHRDFVTGAAFSPDGKQIVTASRDWSARVWNAATGRSVAQLLGHRNGVTSAAFSPDGAQIVTASRDRTALVWDAMTGAPLTPPLRHAAEVTGAAFSPDGRSIVTASASGVAQIWNVATGRPATPPLEHRAEVNHATFSPDGARVATAAVDGTVRVWDAMSGEPLAEMIGHGGEVLSAVFSPDGARVVTASADGTARVWDVITGEQLTPPLEHGDRVTSASFSPDGMRIVTSSWDLTARIWDARTGQPLSMRLEHPGQVNSAAFSPDGTRVVTASSDQSARVWNATPDQLPLRLEHPGRVDSATFSSDGALVVTVSGDGTARVWDARTGQPRSAALAHGGPVTGAAFSPDATRVVTASSDRTARVWDAGTGAPLTPPLPHEGSVHGAAFSPDGTRVVTASGDRTARVWDAGTGKLLTRLEHRDDVHRAAFSPDGTRVVTASADHTARVWDVASGRSLVRIEHRGGVRGAAFSPDGARIVTASADHTARVWDASDGRPLTPPLAHRGAVYSAVFSPDGARVVTTSADQTVQVWDASDGGPLTPPLAHPGCADGAICRPERTTSKAGSSDQDDRPSNGAPGPVDDRGKIVTAAFSADGTRVVTAGAGRTAWIWDATTGRPLMPLEHRGVVSSAMFSADSTRVVTASWDGTARIWEVPLDAGTLARWSAIEALGPYLLNNDVPSIRTVRAAAAGGD